MSKWLCENCNAINPYLSYKCHNCGKEHTPLTASYSASIPFTQDITVLDVIRELQLSLNAANNIIDDFILEQDHMPGCIFTEEGSDKLCQCMDREYYNKKACVERAKKYRLSPR